jgi:hypothetical protein
MATGNRKHGIQHQGVKLTNTAFNNDAPKIQNGLCSPLVIIPYSTVGHQISESDNLNIMDHKNWDQQHGCRYKQYHCILSSRVVFVGSR